MIDFELLSKVGLNQYERQTLLALLRRGIADAATLCEEGEVPNSKIYQATEKLARLGLIHIQRSRPRMFAALSAEDVVERLGNLAREEAEQFAIGTRELLDIVRSSGSGPATATTFADLAMGPREHIRRHVAHLASAETSIVSYMEHADLQAITAAQQDGFNVLRRIRKNAEAASVPHRIVFGFSHRNAPDLIGFVKRFRGDLRSTTGIRYAGMLGHPFHVVDGNLVILSLDNAFLRQRRFASLMIRNSELGSALTEGFETLWTKAMRSLQEIDVHPAAFAEVRPQAMGWRQGPSDA